MTLPRPSRTPGMTATPEPSHTSSSNVTPSLEASGPCEMMGRLAATAWFEAMRLQN